jgi:CRISPR/Cas system-associated endonuclease/helicase Cas3
MNTDFLKQAAQEEGEKAQADSFLVLTNLAECWKAAKAEFEDLERRMKLAKEEFNKISQEDIPNAMMEVGISEFRLSSGEKVSFKEDVSCSVKDYDKLDIFLSDRGEDGMLKTSLEMGKVPKNILSKLLQELNETYGISAIPKRFVHPQTMAAYVRRLCGIDGKTEAEVSVAEIDPEMLSIFRFYKTTVK